MTQTENPEPQGDEPVEAPQPDTGTAPEPDEGNEGTGS